MSTEGRDDQLHALERRLRAALPAEGLAAMPHDLTPHALAELLEQARALIAARPDPVAQLSAKTTLFSARHPFYLATMAAIPPADRHLKPFDRDNSGTLERREIERQMRVSFGKSRFGAWRFGVMLYWIKMGHWGTIPITAARRRAAHPSGSKNWAADGSVDEAQFHSNLGFLSEHADPFSSAALLELIERNTSAARNPGSSSLARALGRRVSMGEYVLAWRMAGVQREDGTHVISEPIYRMNVDGTLITMLLHPREEAEAIFRWRDDGCCRHVPATWRIRARIDI